MTRQTVEAHTDSAEDTMALAEAVATCCRPDDVFALEGSLGAGKTCFVRGLARGLGVEDPRAVLSPTFVLMRIYDGRLTIYHFDAYRLEDAADMEAIGAPEVFAEGGVSVVEWADHVAACLPSEHFTLSVRVTGQTSRHWRLQAHGPGPAERLPQFARALEPWREEA